MAYPFAQAPTIAEVVDKLKKDFGAQERRPTGVVIGPSGLPVGISYLEREVDGQTKRTQALPEERETRAGWDLVRRLCRQLKVDPKDLDIGLDLG